MEYYLFLVGLFCAVWAFSYWTFRVNAKSSPAFTSDRDLGDEHTD